MGREESALGRGHSRGLQWEGKATHAVCLLGSRLVICPVHFDVNLLLACSV